jgi:transposase
MELRRQVLAACDTGLSVEQVARQFDISPSWVRRLKQRRREAGDFGPRQGGGNRRSVIPYPALVRLHAFAAMKPRPTLAQICQTLQRDLGVVCSVMTVHRALKRIEARATQRPTGTTG